MRHNIQRGGSGAMPPHAGNPGGPSTDLQGARLLYRQGHHAEALAAVNALLASRSTQDAPATRRAAALLKTWCLIELKRHGDAQHWLTMCRDCGRLAEDDPAAMTLELNLALFAGEYAHVQAEALRLLDVVTDTADPVHAELRLLLGASLRWLGRFEEAIGHVEFACSAFTVLDEPVRGAVAANFLGWARLSQGRLDESRRWFEKSLAINSGLQSRLRMAQNYQNLAIVCYKQGDYEPAVELLETELTLIDGLNDMICRAKLAMGNVRRLREEFPAARGVLLEAYAIARESRFAREEALALEFLGDILRDEGRPAEAREYYRRSMGVARRIAPRGDMVMELLRREGECLDLEGRHADAHRVLNEALVLAREIGDRFETAVIRRCLGQNAAHLGLLPLARRELEEAAAELSAMTARHEAMFCDYQLARLLCQSDAGKGNLAAAWRSALRAQQLSQELGVPGLAGEIAAVVADLSRRRLGGDAEQPMWKTFSARRSLTSRVVAVSGSLVQALRRCDGFARHECPVLIIGEQGTGRGLLARRIHEHGPHGAQPFVRLDCSGGDGAALTDALFGRAGEGPRGMLARAAGGSLLLSGIESLPPTLQSALLRLIQEGAWRDPADGREHAAPLRIMATGQADLANLTNSGRFRPDLYFRLRLMTVHLAPLRERRQDVLPLFDHFFTRLEGSTLTARSVFCAEDLAAMAEYHWPGNVCELEAIAQQAWLCRRQGLPVVLRQRAGAGGGLLEVVDATAMHPVPHRIAGAHAATDARHASGLTWSSLNSLLARTGGNKARTARQLGVSRMTLYRWLNQLDPTDN